MSDQWLDDYVMTALDNQVYRNGIRWFQVFVRCHTE